MSDPVHFMDVVPAVLIQAERPTLTDVFGRVWTSISGDLYRHDSMTWTKTMVESPNLRGPSADALRFGHWCERCREVSRP